MKKYMYVRGGAYNNQDMLVAIDNIFGKDIYDEEATSLIEDMYTISSAVFFRMKLHPEIFANSQRNYQMTADQQLNYFTRIEVADN